MSHATSTSYCRVCGQHETPENSFACERCHTRYANLPQPSPVVHAEVSPADELMDAMQFMSLSNIPLKPCQHYANNENAQAAHLDCKYCGVCDPISRLGDTKSIITLLREGAKCWHCDFTKPHQGSDPLNNFNDLGSPTLSNDRFPVQQIHNAQIPGVRPRPQNHPDTGFNILARAEEVPQLNYIVRKQSMENLVADLSDWPLGPAPSLTQTTPRPSRPKHRTQRQPMPTTSRVTKSARATQARVSPYQRATQFRPIGTQCTTHRLTSDRPSRTMHNSTHVLAGRFRSGQLEPIVEPTQAPTHSENRQSMPPQDRFSAYGSMATRSQSIGFNRGGRWESPRPGVDVRSTVGTGSPANLLESLTGSFRQMTVRVGNGSAHRQVPPPPAQLEHTDGDGDDDDDEMELR